MPKSSAPTPSYSITVLSSGLHVLRAIGEHPNLRTPQLASKTGLTRSKVFRILRTLEALAYVTLDEDHTARLGPASLILGLQAQQQYTLTQAASSILDELNRNTQENIYLMVREDTHSLIVDFRPSPHPVRIFARVGSTGSLHAGGGSKVLLAHAPSAVIDAVLAQPLERFTPETITDPDRLRAVLDDIRRTDLHITVGDLQDHAFAIATPIRDHQGQVVAALSLAGPTIRYDAEHREKYIQQVKQAAHAISARLGA